MSTPKPPALAATEPHEPRGSHGSRAAGFFRHPLGWMLTGAVGVGAASAVAAAGEPGSAAEIVLPLAGAALAVAVYRTVMHRVARRGTPEIASHRAGTEALSGAAVGAAFVLVSALLIALFGGYSFSWEGGSLWSVVVPVLTVAVGAAVTEELLFRGLVFQAVERLGGSWVALSATALIFGGTHLGNPGATLWSSLAVAVEAGVLLGAAFLWRRSIWFAVGLHFAWNATVAILGIPVSGHTDEGLFAVEADGPTVLTGGDFGLEASLLPVVISLLLAVPMLVMAHRRGHLVPSRRRADTA